MDTITHVCTGALLGRAFTRDRNFKTVAALLLGVSLFPDLDYISRFWGVDVFLRYHRGITHSIVSMFVVCLSLSIVLAVYKKGRFGFWFILSIIGYGMHLLMDMITQYPMRLMAPISWKPYSWDLVFILDPYISGAVLFGIYLTFKSKAHAQRAHIVTAVICILALYVGLRAVLKNTTGNFLARQITSNHYRLCPLPNDFLRWWFVAEDSKEYKTGFVDLFTQSVCLQDILEKGQRNPLIERSKALKEVKNFFYFARQPYPLIEKTSDGTRVVWKELSYSFIPGDHFVAVVEFNRVGIPLRAYAKIR